MRLARTSVGRHTKTHHFFSRSRQLSARMDMSNGPRGGPVCCSGPGPSGGFDVLRSLQRIVRCTGAGVRASSSSRSRPFTRSCAQAPAVPTIDAAIRRDESSRPCRTPPSSLRGCEIPGRFIADHMLARIAAGGYDARHQSGAIRRGRSTDDLRAVNGDKTLLSLRSGASRCGRGGGTSHDGPAYSPARGAAASPPPAAADPARQNHYSLGRGGDIPCPETLRYLETRGFRRRSRRVTDYIVAASIPRWHPMPSSWTRGGTAGAVRSYMLDQPFHDGRHGRIAPPCANRSGNETFHAPHPRVRCRGPAPPDRAALRPDQRQHGVGWRGGLLVRAQEHGAATLVGVREPRAPGHNNAMLDVGHGFVTSISFTRVSDPRTGKERECVGRDTRRGGWIRRRRSTWRTRCHSDGRCHESDPRRRHVLDLTRETVEARLHRAIRHRRLSLATRQTIPRAGPSSSTGAYISSNSGRPARRLTCSSAHRHAPSPCVRPGSHSSTRVPVGFGARHSARRRVAYLRSARRHVLRRSPDPTISALRSIRAIHSNPPRCIDRLSWSPWSSRQLRPPRSVPRHHPRPILRAHEIVALINSAAPATIPAYAETAMGGRMRTPPVRSTSTSCSASASNRRGLELGRGPGGGAGSHYRAPRGRSSPANWSPCRSR